LVIGSFPGIIIGMPIIGMPPPIMPPPIMPPPIKPAGGAAPKPVGAAPGAPASEKPVLRFRRGGLRERLRLREGLRRRRSLSRERLLSRRLSLLSSRLHSTKELSMGIDVRGQGWHLLSLMSMQLFRALGLLVSVTVVVGKGTVQVLTDSSFASAVGQGEWLVEFYAPWVSYTVSRHFDFTVHLRLRR